jgi:hypothetical protein
MSQTLFVSIITALLYLAAGAFREALVVQYYKLIAKNRRYAVSGLAGGVELYDLLVLATVIKSGWNPVLLGAYVIGVMVGTFIGMGNKKC